MRQWIYGALTALGVLIAGLALFIASGTYAISADTPHWPITRALLEWTRERAVARAAADIQVPDLSAESRRIQGARDYAAMCAQCHLAPGMDKSALRQGLNPMPPDLAKHQVDPARAFWIVKHGIKMTGMPAWGQTHDDESLWNIVAFLLVMPDTSAEQYRKWSGSNDAGAPSHGDSGGHGGASHRH